MHRKSLIALLFATTALPALAEDTALVIGNANYSSQAGLSDAADVLDAGKALQDGGFRLADGADLDAPAMRALLGQFYDSSEGGGRTVIALAGRFAHAGGATWLLGPSSAAPSLAAVDGQGLPLATVLGIAAERPGETLIILGTDDEEMDLGRGLMPGIGPLEIPQGVTVLRGDAGAVAEFIGAAGDWRGLSLKGIAAAAPDLVAEGYLGDSTPFLPVDGAEAAPRPAAPAPAPSDGGERSFWEATAAIATPDAYRAYLDRFPQGAHAAEAKAKLAEASNPVNQEQAAEDALNLSRDQRRGIQRNLSVLDFDPKGIDGVFGAGSRAAIANWQAGAGQEATGFLTRDQIARLDAQAARRAAELEAEAAKRKAEQDRDDRLYWTETGDKGDEAGLRAYLKRYPDGLYAELAQDRLDAIEAERIDRAAGAERGAWDKAVQANTAKAYRDYLAAYPDGAFAEDARARVADLTQNPAREEARKKAEAGEAALGLNPAMTSMIEQRLDAMGLKPGATDGKIDGETRRAIRRYQQARGLPVTGYLNQQTVARILVDSL